MDNHRLRTSTFCRAGTCLFLDKASGTADTKSLLCPESYTGNRVETDRGSTHRDHRNSSYSYHSLVCGEVVMVRRRIRISVTIFSLSVTTINGQMATT